MYKMVNGAGSVYRRLLKSVRSGGFVRNAGMLSLGTLAAQVLTFLSYPLLTRLYSPDDFGVVAVVSMMVSILAIVASGAAENAIVIAPTKRSAASVIGWILTRSAIVICGTFIVTGLVVVVDFNDALDPDIRSWIPMVPLLAASVVVFNCFSEWNVREQRFHELARYRIAQSILVASSKILFGLSSIPVNGLVAGETIGKLVSAASGVQSIFRKNTSYFFSISLRRIRYERARFKKFPHYMMPDMLINSLGGTIHVPFIASAFGTSELGLVSLTFSVLYLPVTVVSSAIKDVFRQRAAVEIKKTGSCRTLYLSLLPAVAFVGLLGFGVLYWLSPWMFTFLFGESWGEVGEYTRILIPMFYLNFVSMSMGGVLVVAQRLGVSLGWQLTNLSLTLLALVIGIVLFNTIEAMLWSLTIAKVISYGLYMYLSFHYAENAYTGEHAEG